MPHPGGALTPRSCRKEKSDVSSSYEEWLIRFSEANLGIFYGILVGYVDGILIENLIGNLMGYQTQTLPFFMLKTSQKPCCFSG